MTLNYLGYMLADKGVRLNEALKLIRKAVEQEPMNGAYLDSLGWAYFKLGEYELAEENLRRAVECVRGRADDGLRDGVERVLPDLVGVGRKINLSFGLTIKNA